jgi:glucose/arabinose dehydrogenase
MKPTLVSQIIATLVLFLVIGCNDKTTEVTREEEEEKEKTIQATEAFPLLRFTAPVDIQQAADGTDRLFVVEQAGTIKVFENKSNTSTASVFLDIKSKVTAGGERGLLGLAFHPDFKNNGWFYVNYTKGSPLTTVIARYQSKNPAGNQADPNSETVLLTFGQPFDNHNGGSMQFGKDGYLYIGTGDGGSGGDPGNQAQNRKSMLGKILRLDVNVSTKGNYGIPPDNPFAGNTEGNLPEIYAYGLRNPWKISFDTKTDLLFAADVGQNKREEINLITKGGNYGWRVKEGVDCYNPAANCNAAGLIDPIFDYVQSAGDRSITGGYVYNGTSIPSLVGKYIYGDYVSGRIWALKMNGEKAAGNQLLMANAGSVSTFGQDSSGEIYFANYQNGKIMKLVSQ